MEVVSSSGKWTRSEYVHVQRREYRLGRYELVLIPGLFLYGVIFGYLLWCVAFGLLVYIVGVIGVLPLALWRWTPSLAETRTITVDDKGVTIATTSFRREEEWIAFSGSSERGTYFVLRERRGGRSVIVLKRLFSGPYDEDQLRTLLRANAKLRASKSTKRQS